MLSGKPTGSVASAKPGYRFVGWFSDEECTELLWDKEAFIPSQDTASGLFEDASCYAKFEEILGSLTVKKSGWSSVDANQGFIFRVTSTALVNTNHPAVDMYVTVQGNGSVTIYDLPIGTYTVTEESGWSWRYSSDGAKTAEVDEDGAEVTVTNSRTNGHWLSGSAFVINKS